MLGPINCGKTKLLYAVAQQEKHDSCIAYLDGRLDNFHSPQVLARALAQRLPNWLHYFLRAHGMQH
jgi:hypothetical protein